MKFQITIGTILPKFFIDIIWWCLNPLIGITNSDNLIIFKFVSNQQCEHHMLPILGPGPEPKFLTSIHSDSNNNSSTNWRSYFATNPYSNLTIGWHLVKFSTWNIYNILIFIFTIWIICLNYTHGRLCFSYWNNWTALKFPNS